MAFHTINGRSVAYRLLGSEVNPLIVLAHPLGMSQAVWDDVIPALLPRYRVLTWDLPGHGASQAVSGTQITPADLAEEVLALVALAGVQRFHFAGTSIGGVVGQQLIAAHPDQLLSATLTNTGAVIGNPDLWNTRAGRVRQEGLEAMAEEIVPRWFAPATFEASPALKAGWCVQMGRAMMSPTLSYAKCSAATPLPASFPASAPTFSCLAVVKIWPHRPLPSRPWPKSLMMHHWRYLTASVMCPQ